MATKKKVKAVEPEVVSSVEPEVAAVPMTMAAATPRANGQSTNGFAKVEQGKSYVLSVNAPSGSGEFELLAAEAPSGVYEVLIPNFGVQSTYTIAAYNQGSGNNRPDIIKTLEDCNQPLIYNGDYSDFSGWSYENETGGSTIAIPVGANVVRLSCYFQHVIGEATSLIKVSCNNGFIKRGMDCQRV